MGKPIISEATPRANGALSSLKSFTIFFDAGLIVMLPVIFAVARRLNGPVLAYGIPAAGAFSVMHIYLPPHPGPVAASEFFGADIGLILVFGLLVALPTWYLSGYRLGLHLGKKYPFVVGDILTGERVEDEKLPEKPASPATVIGILLIPMLLIFGNTGLSALSSAGHISGDATWAKFFIFLGQTPIALLITASSRDEDANGFEDLRPTEEPFTTASSSRLLAVMTCQQTQTC